MSRAISMLYNNGYNAVTHMLAIWNSNNYDIESLKLLCAITGWIDDWKLTLFTLSVSVLFFSQNDKVKSFWLRYLLLSLSFILRKETQLHLYKLTSSSWFYWLVSWTKILRKTLSIDVAAMVVVVVVMLMVWCQFLTVISNSMIRKIKIIKYHHEIIGKWFVTIENIVALHHFTTLRAWGEVMLFLAQIYFVLRFLVVSTATVKCEIYILDAVILAIVMT